MWTLPSAGSPSGRFSDEDMRIFIGTLADAVVKRNLELPVGFVLETMKPFAFIGSQVFVALTPLLDIMIEAAALEKTVELFGRRAWVESLQQRIEALSQQRRGSDPHR